MNAMPDPAAPASIVRALVGWGIKYAACGVLTILLPLCFGALLLVFIVLTQSGAPPQALAHVNHATLHSGDLRRYIGLGFLLVSVLLTALSWLRRTLRHRRGSLPARNAAQPMARHLSLHAGRRLLVGFGVVGAIYVGAFACIPFAHMAAHASHAGLFGVFIALFVIALASTAMYVVLDLAADWVLDG